MDQKECREYGRKLLENIGKVIVGKEETIQLLLAALLSGGHVLLEDMPGTGKTKLAKAWQPVWRVFFPESSLRRTSFPAM